MGFQPETHTRTLLRITQPQNMCSEKKNQRGVSEFKRFMRFRSREHPLVDAMATNVILVVGSLVQGVELFSMFG